MLVGVFGKQGSGKSLFSILLGRLILSIDNNIDLYTNMNVTGNNINVVNDLGDIPLQDGRKKILIVDEAMFSLDSRSSSSKNNKIWTRALAFFRKADFILVIFATHRPNMLDVRIREQLSYVFMARRSRDYFEYLLIDITTYVQRFFKLKKSDFLFTYADFNTKDFPNVLDITKLEDSLLFSIRK